MSPDHLLTLGLILAILSVPMYISALADTRSPRLAIASALIAAGCLAYAFTNKPGGYTWQQVPDVVIEVAAGLIK